MKEFKGVIVEESLNDNRIINQLKVISLCISGHKNPLERWHLYTVMVSEEEIEKLSECIKDKWYMHFLKDRQIIALFKGKKFIFNYDDKTTWKPAVDYGLSIGIPESQLDFLMH
ncbi:hypothetical protein KPL47_21390 [Clostridium estertheticum]|uniref:hypothetical protein n=1 Tax=Clostridium estertheticum TaxID=238834 RepID=UPI001C0D1E2C|nr:hypothetical protein [Clostridium estertheticum]MBU3178868.1 hypothetical protein [Clostridium estertheticum]